MTQRTTTRSGRSLPHPLRGVGPYSLSSHPPRFDFHSPIKFAPCLFSFYSIRREHPPMTSRSLLNPPSTSPVVYALILNHFSALLCYLFSFYPHHLTFCSPQVCSPIFLYCVYYLTSTFARLIPHDGGSYSRHLSLGPDDCTRCPTGKNCKPLQVPGVTPVGCECHMA